MEKVKLKSILDWLPKSTLKASEGLEQGKYPFFTSSQNQSKWTNEAIYDDNCLIFGTGGNPSIHNYEGRFSSSTDCFVTKLNKSQRKINIKYIFYFLKTNVGVLERGFKGIAIKHISKNYLENIEIIIPSLEEQNRIVTILDKVELILFNRRSVNVNQAKLLKSIFYNTFKNFFSGETIPLINYTDIISGITKGKDYKNKAIVEVPYLRVANVQDGYLDLSEIKTISATLVEIEKYSLFYNDLLLTEGGDPDKLGRGFLWRDEIKDCIFQNHLFRVRISDTNKLSPIFLCYLISSVYGKAYFLKSARQTTGIATINLAHIKNFPVFIPSIELQDSFSKQALKIENLIAQNNKKIYLLETLLKALSQLAFTGKLKINDLIDLESLLQEDYNYFKIHSNKKTIELLIERLDKNVLNQKKFNDIETYDKAKNFVLQLLKDNKIVQVFDTNKKNVKLALK